MPRLAADVWLRLAGRALDVAVYSATTLTLVVAVIGRLDLQWAGIRLRIGTPWRPLAVLAILLVIRTAFGRRRPKALGPPAPDGALARVGFLALLTTMLVAYVYFGVRVCGGLDSYGYISASELIASGTLRERQPLAAWLPYPEAARVAAPLGFVVGADGESRVPRFPLGLPLVMAFFRLAGREAPFFVPLAMGVGALCLAYAMGGRGRDRGDGLFAASVLGASPTLVNGTIQPLSDVAATFWVMAAVWLAVVRRSSPRLAGACMGMALLTRPALAGAAAALVFASLLAGRSAAQGSDRARGWGDLRFTGRVAATIAVFVAGLALINRELFGAFWDTGYGSTRGLFDPGRIVVNLSTYAKWITYSHGAWLWVALAAALAALRRESWMWGCLLVAGGASAPYLLYFTWDDWEATRFVLPGLALTLVVACRGTMDVLAASPASRLRPWLALIVAVLCAGASTHFLRTHGVLDYWRSEAKYPRLGAWVQDHTPAATVVISGLHSGSLRYYSGRETLRWDEMPPDALTLSVASLERQGYAVYLALDVPSEGERFRERFRLQLGQLSQVPAVSLGDTHVYRLKSKSL